MNFPILKKGGALLYNKKKKTTIAVPDAIAMNKFFAGKSPYSAEKGSKIKIKPENKGKFTSWCKSQGFNSVTKQCIAKGKASKNKSIVKQATFADNASKWKKEQGGILNTNSMKFKVIKKQQGGTLTILDKKGGVQKEIVSGARVISIPETKKIIKEVNSIKTPTDANFMKLGQMLVDVFEGQDNRPTEYV